MTESQRPEAGGSTTSIGRYQVLDVVGRGAMGIVYKAHDPAIDRDVAIKVVRIDAVNQEERAAAVDRFRQEVQAAGRCSHPGIVGVFDFLDQDGDPAIVMELVEGGSLHAHLRDPVRRAAIDPAGVVLQLLRALGYAHGQGIIHRDVKPANILMTGAGQAKIADFGIARLSGPSATTTSAMLGTPSYMAPEQLTGDAVDARADLFAVGAIFYEMLTGRPPFAGRSMPDTLSRLSSPDPADMGPVLECGGHPFVALLRQSLAKDRAQRFQTAGDHISALLGAMAAQRAALDDPQATVVRPLRAPPAPAQSGAWDPALLQRLEQQLAHFLGPMARMMVARASKDAADLDDLLAALAQSLPNAADRSQFLRAAGRDRVEPSLGSSRTGFQAMGRSAATGGSRSAVTGGSRSAATGGSRSAATGGSGSAMSGGSRSPATGGMQSRATTTLIGPVSVSPEAAAAAQAALVQFVGPIARVLVRDAAAQATSSRDFIERLCAHVTKPDELITLRRRLRADVEPKLL